MYGRKPFYVGGLILFMVASVLSGTAPLILVARGRPGREGVGMGTLMPLSQAIIGDIIPPRIAWQIPKDSMGMAFGSASISGPPLGGWLTDTFRGGGCFSSTFRSAWLCSGSF